MSFPLIFVIPSETVQLKNNHFFSTLSVSWSNYGSYVSNNDDVKIILLSVTPLHNSKERN